VGDAKRERNIAYVGFAVGSVGVVTAVILYATAASSGSSSQRGTALQLTPVLGSNDWGAALSGSF